MTDTIDILSKFEKRLKEEITEYVNDIPGEWDNSVRIPVQQRLEFVRDYILTDILDELKEEQDNKNKDLQSLKKEARKPSIYRCNTCDKYKWEGCIALAKDTSLISEVGCISHSSFPFREQMIRDDERRKIRHERKYRHE
jgi:hypothetical protein